MGGSARDLNGLRGGADYKLEVCPVLLVDFELDASLNRSLESRGFDPDRIILSHRDSEELIAARWVSLDPALKPCTRIRQDHGRVGNSGAGWVKHCTKDAGGHFRLQKLAAQYKQGGNANQTFV